MSSKKGSNRKNMQDAERVGYNKMRGTLWAAVPQMRVMRERRERTRERKKRKEKTHDNRLTHDHDAILDERGRCLNTSEQYQSPYWVIEPGGKKRVASSRIGYTCRRYAAYSNNVSKNVSKKEEKR